MPTGIIYPPPTAVPTPVFTGISDEDFLETVAKIREEQAALWLARKRLEAIAAAKHRAHLVVDAEGNDYVPEYHDPIPKPLVDVLRDFFFTDVLNAAFDYLVAYPPPSGTTPGIRRPDRNSGNFARAGMNSYSRGKGGVYTPVAGQRARRGSAPSNRRRSEKLGAGWVRLPSDFGNLDMGGAYNDVTYAGWVHGKQQSGVMKRRGWRTISDVVQKLNRPIWEGVVILGFRLYLATGYGIFFDKK